ncbi:hypothetical protein Mal48_08450 [Thalassoglobus polymorphus]|uniref:Uncharacterized protein n=1 Tax=Thalassoglobus polymorphus TaxID=2527994 RepID=A0A517QIY1_9PLAN|nr:hypothetical protein Mal48_08450 [Thalassoglobus polymorphus]
MESSPLMRKMQRIYTKFCFMSQSITTNKIDVLNVRVTARSYVQNRLAYAAMATMTAPTTRRGISLRCSSERIFAPGEGAMRPAL